MFTATQESKGKKEKKTCEQMQKVIVRSRCSTVYQSNAIRECEGKKVSNSNNNQMGIHFV